ncbi:MAG: tetratricopeptide repeat protein [Tepidisphaeraceae bacterium]
MLKRTLPFLTACIAVAGLVGCKSSDSKSASAEARIATEEDKPFLKPEPINSNTQLAAGRLAESQGRFDDAIANYRACLRADANNKQAIYRLAITFTLAKRVDEALAAWQRYVQVTNDSPDALANLAYTHQLAGHWKEAEVNYLRALTADPKCKYARVNYGLLLVNRDRLDEAESHLGMVLTPPQVEYNIASVFELRGMVAEARKHYLEAVRLDPDFREAQTRLRMLDAQASVK